MDAPNKREADCCATCKFSSPNFDTVTCSEYGMMLAENICDDFERGMSE